jgi:tetratricopeptide (TPR) repeat protein
VTSTGQSAAVNVDRHEHSRVAAWIGVHIGLISRFPNPYVTIGNALLDKQPRDLDGAIMEYRTAIAIDPKLAYAFYNCGNAFDQQGKWLDALKMRSKYIDLAPKDPDGYAAIDRTIGSIPDLGSTKAEFEQATKLEADNWAVKYILAEMEKKLASSSKDEIH